MHTNMLYRSRMLLKINREAYMARIAALNIKKVSNVTHTNPFWLTIINESILL